MKHSNQGVVQHAFSTPLLSRSWPDSDVLNAGLLEIIARKRGESPGVSRSLRRGWHSELDLFEWGTSEVNDLAQRVFACFQQITRESATVAGQVTGGLSLYGWANVTSPGGYHRVHNHAGAMWSGVYYVATGTPDPASPESGVLELVDPRLGANMIATPGRPFGTNLRIVPEPGLMLLFPSWLAHFVNPFEGEGERVSISFNITGQR